MHCCSVSCHLLCISAFDVRVLTGFLICVQICIHLLYGSNLEEQCSGELKYGNIEGGKINGGLE
jgi:hypothetical protein